MMKNSRAKEIAEYRKDNTELQTAKQFGLSTSSVDRYCREWKNKGKEKKRNKGRVVGVIADTHHPFCHPDYLQFCIDTFHEYGVTDVVHIGDLIDNQSLNFHDSDPGLKGAYGEKVDALELLHPWKKAFPKMVITIGNHDSIPARQMKRIGLDPKTYMRPLADIYEFPSGWSIVPDIVIDDVLYEHGMSALGIMGFHRNSVTKMQSTVTGHAHSSFGVSWTASHQKLIFGLGVGCGIDIASMAFAYNKAFRRRPVLGCGVVIKNGKQPIAVPMQLGGQSE